MGLRYDFPIDHTKKNTVYSRVIAWAGSGKRVLDVGCDTGNLGGWLATSALSVDGVEMDPDAAKKATERLDNVYTGSIEDAGVLKSLKGPYDLIIFADVLEHLANPGNTLEKMKPLLSSSGEVVASLPNVANFRVRIPLLFGRFDYTETGILDRTHLRFFTRKTAAVLFTKAGYRILDIKPAATFMPTALLYLWPGLFATRFVIKATPA